jgi:serine/threonine protein kinase
VARGRDYLGTYRLVRLIRAGQTCQVWEALSDVDNARYALKALQPDYRDDRSEIAFLKHEFEVAKGFDHPNVIHVYEFSTDRQVPFLVLELGRGRNMKLIIRDQADQYLHMLPQIIEGCAEGLKYLHEQGWVHCDIKPDNYLLAENGDVKLIDFAIAQRQRSGLARLLTLRGKIQGTRSYMAPEQIRGKAPDLRTDIYSFGCSLYELLAGKPPFTGSTPAELLNKHLHAAIPVLAGANSNVTPGFSDLVAKMMAKDVSQRPRSMGDFLAEFKSIRVFRVLPKPPEPRGDQQADSEQDSGTRGS